MIVPYRGEATGVRRRNLDAVLRWLTALPITVVVSEHDGESLVDGTLPRGVGHVLLARRGPFAKAAACNAGVAAVPDASVLAVVDADILLRADAFLACVRRCEQGVGAIRPFGRLVELDPEQSREVVATGAFPQLPDAPPSDARGGERIPFCGGAFVVRRDVYDAVGGMDETFVGWGGEDDAMSIALARRGASRQVLRSHAACHLWHDRPVRRYRDPAYAANVERLRRTLSMPPPGGPAPESSVQPTVDPVGQVSRPVSSAGSRSSRS